MLVLSRKVNESIRIGDYKVMIVGVDKKTGKVRLGIEAPRAVSVHREEVYQAIRRNEAVQTETAEGSASVTEDLCHAR